MVNGGSSQQTVNGSATFTTAIMAMDGVDGYYELTLPGSVSTSDLVLSASPILGSSTTLPLEFAVTSGGVLGPYTLQNMHIVHVGTGDVQVSVSWSGASDVDLHVIDPNNEEVYYAHRTAASGGTLDLDSNAGCSIDNTNNENIVWPVGSAPAGTYTVRVDYWSACSVTQSDYVVTVHTTHGTTQFFTGSLTGAGDGGGAGSGATITTFTF
jgi:hypothetical protein